jgi:predicted unusual protein kinase regulating ubiquinone biosynthesis (AarF/ABC1/UbiB family)
VWKELDFRTEGDNIQRAYEGFSKSGLEVDVPQLVTTTNSVLVR